jgi:hypothetical protein
MHSFFLSKSKTLKNKTKGIEIECKKNKNKNLWWLKYVNVKIIDNNKMNKKSPYGLKYYIV